MTTTYTKDGVSVTLSGSALTMARRAAEAASRGVLSELEAMAGAVATEAREKWYTLVHRRTGLTGNIGVITRISATEVRVSVGSLDQRTAGGKRIPLFVRQPRATALMAKQVTNQEWGEAKQAGMPVGPIGTIYVPNDKAASGAPKFLVPFLVRGPMRALVKARMGQLAAAAVRSVNRG